MGKSLQHAAMALPRGYLFGLTLSTAGSSTTFTTAAGEAVDDTFVDLMTLGSSLAKTTGSWAVGAAAGSLDTGTIAASTWYHVYLIKRVDTGVVDVLISLSATSPTMPTNYTIKRRIGSMLTNGSSQWTLFSQFGDEFLWSVPFTDVNAVVNPGTAAVTRTLTVPTGIAVQAKFSIMCVSTDTTPQQDTRVVVSSLDRSDQTPSPTTDSMGSFIASATGTGAATAEMTVRTNTSAQIRTRNSASSIGVNLNIGTIGWIDTRGKLS